MYSKINRYILEKIDEADFNDVLIVNCSKKDKSILDLFDDYCKSVGLAEYLTGQRLYSKVIDIDNFNLSFIKFFRAFIFLNPKKTITVLKFIQKANFFNKKLFKIITEEDNPIFQDMETLQDVPLVLTEELLKTLQDTHEYKYQYGYVVDNASDIDKIEDLLSSESEYSAQAKFAVISNKSKLKIYVSRKILPKMELIYYSSIPELIKLENSVRKISRKLTSHIKNNIHLYVPSLDVNFSFAHMIRSKLTKNICFNVPGTVVRGGINVIVKHCHTLRNNGYDVTLISDGIDENNISTRDGEINVVSRHLRNIKVNIDKLVATLWITSFFVGEYPDAREKLYLVQNYETGFSVIGDPYRILANITYLNAGIKPITISKWCQKWLKEKYNRDAKYCPNGLNSNMFKFVKKDFSGKIRVLIEGSNKEFFRNIDESFRIANRLDRRKFEVWYLTYDGAPKDWYIIDKFLHCIPHEKVPKIYQKTHILLKSSRLESFSYPPLEMMSTGGVVVVALNDGNSEYVIHEHNCMVYKAGDEDKAYEYINRLASDNELRTKLIKNGRLLAESKDWKNIEEQILKLYQ